MRANEQPWGILMQPLVQPAQITRRIHGNAHTQRFHPNSKEAVHLPHRQGEKGTRGAAWLLGQLRYCFAAGNDFFRLYGVNHVSNQTCRCNICRPFALSDPFSCTPHDAPVLSLISACAAVGAKNRPLSATILRSRWSMP